MFLPPLSGWRRGPAGSSVPSVKQESAERKSSRCTAEGAPAKRTPGTSGGLWVNSAKIASPLPSDWLFVFAPQVENSTSTSGTENRAREPRRGERIDLSPRIFLSLFFLSYFLNSVLVSVRQMFQGFGDTGFHMSFGIGAFPFGFFTTVFNTNDPFHRAGKHTGDDQIRTLVDLMFCGWIHCMQLHTVFCFCFFLAVKFRGRFDNQFVSLSNLLWKISCTSEPDFWDGHHFSKWRKKHLFSPFC